MNRLRFAVLTCLASLCLLGNCHSNFAQSIAQIGNFTGLLTSDTNGEAQTTVPDGTATFAWLTSATVNETVDSNGETSVTIRNVSFDNNTDSRIDRTSGFGHDKDVAETADDAELLTAEDIKIRDSLISKFTGSIIFESSLRESQHPNKVDPSSEISFHLSAIQAMAAPAVTSDEPRNSTGGDFVQINRASPAPLDENKRFVNEFLIVNRERDAASPVVVEFKRFDNDGTTDGTTANEMRSFVTAGKSIGTLVTIGDIGFADNSIGGDDKDLESSSSAIVTSLSVPSVQWLVIP